MLYLIATCSNQNEVVKLNYTNVKKQPITMNLPENNSRHSNSSQGDVKSVFGDHNYLPHMEINNLMLGGSRRTSICTVDNEPNVAIRVTNRLREMLETIRESENRDEATDFKDCFSLLDNLKEIIRTKAMEVNRPEYRINISDEDVEDLSATFSDDHSEPLEWNSVLTHKRTPKDLLESIVKFRQIGRDIVMQSNSVISEMRKTHPNWELIENNIIKVTNETRDKIDKFLDEDRGNGSIETIDNHNLLSDQDFMDISENLEGILNGSELINDIESDKQSVLIPTEFDSESARCTVTNINNVNGNMQTDIPLPTFDEALLETETEPEPETSIKIEDDALNEQDILGLLNFQKLDHVYTRKQLANLNLQNKTTMSKKNDDNLIDEIMNESEECITESNEEVNDKSEINFDKLEKEFIENLNRDAIRDILKNLDDEEDDESDSILSISEADDSSAEDETNAVDNNSGSEEADESSDEDDSSENTYQGIDVNKKYRPKRTESDLSLNSEPNSSDNFELNNTQPIKLSSEESANVPDTVVKKPKIIANNKFVEIDDFIDFTKEDEAAVVSLSSDSEPEDGQVVTDNKKVRGKIRPILKPEQLDVNTKRAQKAEHNRLELLKKCEAQLKVAIKKHKAECEQLQVPPVDEKLVLDYDTEAKEFISIDPKLAMCMKPHQIEGVKFLYRCCYASVKDDKNAKSGAILAHCMGLGKTLTTIAFLHTLVKNPKLNTRRMLVLCPKSVIINWCEEFIRWQGVNQLDISLQCFTFSENCTLPDKISTLKRWYNLPQDKRQGHVLIMGQELFRTLVNDRSYEANSEAATKKYNDMKNAVVEHLLDPGSDIVILDEGHIIKNNQSAISVAVSQIRSKRRIILTGTPIQNHLREYYCMVNFVKPGFLGTEKEFANQYANPIKYGQHKDSSQQQIKVMKRRSFILHKNLSSFVQRMDVAVLKEFLPIKHEYVLYIPLTDLQERLYTHYLTNLATMDNLGGRGLIRDFAYLRKIWTHPKVLQDRWESLQKNSKTKNTLSYDSDDAVMASLPQNEKQLNFLEKNWWGSISKKEEFYSLMVSNKLFIMFKILRHCQDIGEKCLVFSAYTAVLDLIEEFMKMIDQQNFTHVASMFGIDQFFGTWKPRADYFRLDGKTNKHERHELIKCFNSPSNKRARVFLISSRAGGQGINLTGANRCILLDTSWNPSVDQQNIFRIYRLGQTKECFAYRLLAMGTMEEKIYSRSVTKQALSFRVVDEQQIERHFRMEELSALYCYTKPDMKNRITSSVPVDKLLAGLLLAYPSIIYKYHEHDSMLENKTEDELNEQEKQEAWDDYIKENESQPTLATNNQTLAEVRQNPSKPYADLLSNMYGNPLLMNNPSVDYSRLLESGVQDYFKALMNTNYGNPTMNPALNGNPLNHIKPPGYDSTFPPTLPGVNPTDYGYPFDNRLLSQWNRNLMSGYSHSNRSGSSSGSKRDREAYRQRIPNNDFLRNMETNRRTSINDMNNINRTEAMQSLRNSLSPNDTLQTLRNMTGLDLSKTNPVTKEPMAQSVPLVPQPNTVDKAMNKSNISNQTKNNSAVISKPNSSELINTLNRPLPVEVSQLQKEPERRKTSSPSVITAHYDLTCDGSEKSLPLLNSLMTPTLRGITEQATVKTKGDNRASGRASMPATASHSNSPVMQQPIHNIRPNAPRLPTMPIPGQDKFSQSYNHNFIDELAKNLSNSNPPRIYRPNRTKSKAKSMNGNNQMKSGIPAKERPQMNSNHSVTRPSTSMNQAVKKPIVTKVMSLADMNPQNNSSMSSFDQRRMNYIRHMDELRQKGKQRHSNPPPLTSSNPSSSSVSKPLVPANQIELNNKVSAITKEKPSIPQVANNMKRNGVTIELIPTTESKSASSSSFAVQNSIGNQYPRIHNSTTITPIPSPIKGKKRVMENTQKDYPPQKLFKPDG